MGHVTVSRVILFGVSFGNNFPPQHPRIYRFRTRFSREANQIKIPTYAISLLFFFFFLPPRLPSTGPGLPLLIFSVPFTDEPPPPRRRIIRLYTYVQNIIYFSIVPTHILEHGNLTDGRNDDGPTASRVLYQRVRTHTPSVRADPRTVHPENPWHPFKNT